MNGIQEKQKYEFAPIVIAPTGIKKKILRKKCKCGCGSFIIWDKGHYLRGHHRRTIVNVSNRTKLSRWRTSVLKRDNYICQKCFGEKMQLRLSAHHIKPKKQFPELIYEINNGLTLCTACHNSYHPVTEETKRKSSISHKNLPPMSEEVKQKISKTLTGRKLTGTQLINTRIARAKQIGVKRSSETCIKIGLGHKGKIISKETKEKMSIAKRGISLTEEHKRKIGEASRHFQQRRRDCD